MKKRLLFSDRRRFFQIIIPLLIVVLIVTLVIFSFLIPNLSKKTSPRSTLTSQISTAKCIRTTSFDQESPANNSVQSTLLETAPGSATPAIESLTEDTSGCLKFVGDIIHFSMIVGETSGVATIDIGKVHKGIQLYDDGTHGDKVANDGIYENTYETTSTDIIRSGTITGHFKSKDGKEALPINTSSLVTITDWNASGGSIDQDVNYIPHPVTGEMYDPNRVIILFKEGTSKEAIMNSLENLNLKLSSWIPELFEVEVALTGGQNYDEIRKLLLESLSVEAVGLNFAMETQEVPLPMLDEYLPVQQANYMNLIRAKLGWNITKGQSIIDVTEIESGVDQNHKDLMGQITNYSPNENIDDQDGHGTFIAGLIVAKQGNSGISGIAPDIKLSFYKRETNDFSINNNISKAADNHTRVISISFCFNIELIPEDNFRALLLHRAIKYAYDRNVIIVAGVGEGTKEKSTCGGPQRFYKDGEGGLGAHRVYPASFKEVLAVGASDINDKHATYSDWGTQIIYAPVPSTTLGIWSSWNNGRYNLKAGTSYAAPQVAALAALILSVNKDLTNDQVVNYIKSTADKSGQDGLGRINVYRALMETSPGKQDPGEYPLPTPISNLSSVVDHSPSLSVNLSWPIPNGDYAGVHIYRIIHLNSNDFITSQLEGGLITGSSYRDQYVSDGSTYEYFVFSVDSRGQESVKPASTEVLVKQQTGVAGNWIAYVGPGENVWLIHPDGTGLTQLTFDGKAGRGYWDLVVGYRNLKWSPDGSMLGMLRVDQGGTQIQAISMSDKKINTLLSNTEGSFDWLPDSRTIIYSNIPYKTRQQSPGGLSVFNIDSSLSSTYIETNPKIGLVWPDWADQGDYVYFSIQPAPLPDVIWGDTLGLASAPGSGYLEVQNSALGCDWSPDGQRFVCRSGSGEILCSDLVIFSALGIKISEITPGAGCTQTIYPSWSPDGDWIAFSGDIGYQSGIFIINPDGSKLTYLGEGLLGNTFLNWSPDSKSLAYLSDRNGNVDIYITNILNTQTHNLTNSPGNERSLAWQPITAANQPIPITPTTITPTTTPILTPSPTSSPSLSGLITYIGTDRNIWVISPDGSGKRQITTKGNYFEPQWSPDSSSIAFVQTITTSNGDQATQIGVLTLNDFSEKIVIPPEKTGLLLLHRYYEYSNPRWSADGKYIYFIASDGRVQGDDVRKVDVATRQEDSNFVQFFSRGFDISPTSQKIVCKDFSNAVPTGDGLYLYNLSGSWIGTVLPVSQGGSYSYPSWIPNSARVSYIDYKYDTKTYALISINQDGSNQSTLFASNTLKLLSYSWSADGKIVVVDTDGIIQLIDLSTKTTQILVDGTFPDWSSTSLDVRGITPVPETTSVPAANSSMAQITYHVAEVNLRATPGYMNKDDFTDVIVKIPAGQLIEIIGGSVQKDGLTWWNITWNGYTGWIADHTGSGLDIINFNP